MKVKISEVFRNLSVTKRVILGSITLLVTGYMFCLPRQLFHVPYSTVVTARNEELLGARIASDGQWRFPPRNTTPEKIKHCLITFEDKHFIIIGVLIHLPSEEPFIKTSRTNVL